MHHIAMAGRLLLWLTIGWAAYCNAAAAAVPPLKPLRMSIDFGSYRGYWRIEDKAGREITHDECFTQRVCRETLAPLPEGEYALVFSSEPQSAQVRFRLTPTGLIVTSGENLAAADALTLRMKGLLPVVFALNGYDGAWSLDLWKGAEATGFFKRRADQTIELFPMITYTLNVGALHTERFQIGRDGKIILIDDSGVVRVADDVKNKLTVQTIDVAFYPAPLPDAAQWSIEGITPPDGRGRFVGPRILRLAQGTGYQITDADAGTESGKVIAKLATGKACNMSVQRLQLQTISLYAVPIAASCTSGQRRD